MADTFKKSSQDEGRLIWSFPKRNERVLNRAVWRMVQRDHRWNGEDGLRKDDGID